MMGCNLVKAEAALGVHVDAAVLKYHRYAFQTSRDCLTGKSPDSSRTSPSVHCIMVQILPPEDEGRGSAARKRDLLLLH